MSDKKDKKDGQPAKLEKDDPDKYRRIWYRLHLGNVPRAASWQTLKDWVRKGGGRVENTQVSGSGSATVVVKGKDNYEKAKARLEKDQMWKKNIIVYPTGPFTFDELTGMPSVPPPSAPAAAPPRAAPAYRPAPAFTTTSYGGPYGAPPAQLPAPTQPSSFTQSWWPAQAPGFGSARPPKPAEKKDPGPPQYYGTPTPGGIPANLIRDYQPISIPGDRSVRKMVVEDISPVARDELIRFMSQLSVTHDSPIERWDFTLGGSNPRAQQAHFLFTTAEGAARILSILGGGFTVGGHGLRATLANENATTSLVDMGSGTRQAAPVAHGTRPDQPPPEAGPAEEGSERRQHKSENNPKDPKKRGGGRGHSGRKHR